MSSTFSECLGYMTRQLRLLTIKTELTNQLSQFEPEIELQRNVYLSVSEYVRAHMTEREIHHAWIESNLGSKTTESKTLHKWLTPGPKSKNIYFEPFILELALGIWFDNHHRTLPDWNEDRWQNPTGWLEELQNVSTDK